MRKAIVVLVVWWLSWPAAAQEGLRDAILQLSGGQRVKIVWQRDTTDSADHVFGGANVYRLMGYDTSDDTIQVILPGPDDFTKPLLTHDGERVVFSDRVERKVWVVGWDGGNLQQVADGFAGTLWFDPASGTQWVYLQKNGDGDNASLPLVRVDLDDPATEELVWDDSDTNALWMSISSDGTRIASSWPWSSCGVIVPSYDGTGGGELHASAGGTYENGCWTTVTPDTRYTVGVFDGPHRAWKVWDWPPGARRMLDLHSAPGIDGWEIYHPRMANHPRLLTMTGPYSNGTMGDNNIRAGGRQIEVYLGRVDVAFTVVTDWIRITSDDRADLYPCAWVDPGTTPTVRIDSFSAAPETIPSGGSSTLSWSTTNADTVSIQPDVGAVSADGSAAVSPAADTTYTLTAEGEGGPATRQVTVQVVSVDLPLAINCGDGTPAVAGWIDEDVFRTGGEPYDFTGTVDLNGQPDPAPADVYTTCIHLDHAYSFPVPDDSYTVRLHFYDQHGGDRRMDYAIEGVKVLDDFDIAAAAGGTQRALVREFTIVVADGDGMQVVAESDAGNDVFEAGIEVMASGQQDLEPPVVAITAPGDGQTLQGDIEVQGTASDNLALARVEIGVDDEAYQEAEGTSDWSHTIYALGLDDGLHTITARATDTSGNQGFDSIQVTTDNQASVSIQRPAGAETWQAGATETIRWTTSNLDDVTLHFSVDDGATWQEIVQSVASHQPSWGAYPWTVPNEPTGQARILIHGYFDSTVRAVSEPFTITSSGQPELRLLAPEGGESLTGSEQFQIVFEAQDVETVVIDFSANDGADYETLATVQEGGAGWLDHGWTVPDISTRMARIRIHTPGGAVEDTSGAFSITPSSTGPQNLEVERLRFSGQIPAVAGRIQQVTVGDRTFDVADDRSFEAEVAIPAGAERVVVEMSATDGNTAFQRMLELEVENAAPPIPGLGVSAAELRAFVGGRGGVLVWVDAGGSIQVLDFRVDAPRVETLVEAGDCINPLLSPDASRVVYSRGQANGPKFIRVRALGGGEAELVGTGDLGYWSFAGGREAVVYCDWSEKTLNGEGGATWLQELETGGTRLVGDAEQLCARAMDAGPNGTLRWLGQVYGQLWAYDLDAGVAYPTEKFELMGGGVADHQTCNGSMAPDASGRLMCLVIPHDYVRVFGYREASDTWQQEAELELRAGMAEWEFPEWSTDAGYFTAVMRGPDLQNRLFIVKMETGRVVPEALEVSGEERGMTYSHLYLEP